jgi:inorganic pyrophosphatase
MQRFSAVLMFANVRRSVTRQTVRARPYLRRHDLAIGDTAPDIVNAVIEIPRGSKVKYELDKDTGAVEPSPILSLPIC